MFLSSVFKLALQVFLLFEELFGVLFPILNIFQLLSSFGNFSFFVIMLDHKIGIKLSKIFIVDIQILLLFSNKFFCLFDFFFNTCGISIYIIGLILDTLIVSALSIVVRSLKFFTFSGQFLIVWNQKFSSILLLEKGNFIVDCLLFYFFILT